ncbi:patatin-like phospholipase domain-containing protein 2 [Archocentrus centrarchus]|uniref:patatin-like phospholipase domain-containing protein 2 n=1 Tax=Archocentrus centrarchus TaxID=63155 RepID=UPI0011EA1D4B|nr:patatin-like phospholipase domain-containing protein 2 [Archocentrus centrarchus]
MKLLRTVRDSLLEKLPEDAHLRASGKLCVSLTRITDGKNVLVSEFASREELIQVLTCSCFFPVYCGFIPPSYHGVLYMDGALSNNMPLFEQRNTITMAPFSGESDICPREGTFNLLEVHYGNVSIQVNTGNVHRICTSFLPPRLETLAEICHNGYMDALCFLRDRDLLGAQNITSSVVGAKLPCCEPMKEVGQAEDRGVIKCDKADHQWLDRKVIENLPAAIKKLLCEACKDSHDGGSWWQSFRDFLPVKLVMYLLTLLILPIELTILFTKSVISFICTAVCRLLTGSADLYRQKRSISDKGVNSASQENNCIWRSSGSNSRKRDKNIQTLSSRMTNSKINLHWDTNSNVGLMPPMSARTVSPASSKVMLNTPVKGHIINHKQLGKKD